MPIASDSLPDDIAALKALLLARDGEVAQLRTTVSTYYFPVPKIVI